MHAKDVLYPTRTQKKIDLCESETLYCAHNEYSAHSSHTRVFLLDYEASVQSCLDRIGVGDGADTIAYI